MTLILKASYVYDAMKKIHEKSCKSPTFFVSLQAVCKIFVDLKA